MKIQIELTPTLQCYLCAIILYHREIGRDVRSISELIQLVLLPDLAVEGGVRRRIVNGTMDGLLAQSQNPLTEMFLHSLRSGASYGFAFSDQNTTPPRE